MIPQTYAEEAEENEDIVDEIDTVGAILTDSASSPARQMTLGDIAHLLGGELVGDAQTLITGVAELASAVPGTIAFVEHEKMLKEAMASAASALILPDNTDLRLQDAARAAGKPAVLTGNPRLAFAKLMAYLQPTLLPEKGIHPTAIIESDAYIGSDVTIREFCYVGHHAHIGDNVVLYPHSVVGDGAQIGDATHLQYGVVLYPNVHVGKRVHIHANSVIGSDGFGYVFHEGKHHKVPQVGTVVIEDDVEIGSNVCIDRAMLGATRVGEGSKIDNQVQIAHNVQIGRDCIVCAQVGLSGSVIVGDNAILAGQAGVRDHLHIGKGSVIGAKSGVMTDAADGEYMTGSPAVPNREFMRKEAASRKLPDALRALRHMEKRISELERKLAEQ